jgi:hypothetical protein
MSYSSFRLADLVHQFELILEDRTNLFEDVLYHFSICLPDIRYRGGRPQGFAPTGIYGTLFEKWY